MNCFSSINQFLVNWFRQWSSLRNQDKLIVYFCLYAALIKPTARTLFKNLIPKWPSKAMSFYLNIYFACFFFNLFNWCMHFACSSSFSTNYTWKLYIYFVTFMQITLNLLFVCIHNLHYNISICKVWLTIQVELGFWKLTRVYFWCPTKENANHLVEYCVSVSFASAP